jgi:hypothetical protein
LTTRHQLTKGLWVAAPLLVLALASGCSSTDEADAPETWGDEAVAYLGALSSALTRDDFYDVLDFYAPGAEVYVGRTGFSRGRVITFLNRGPRLDQELLAVHLGDEDALRLIWWPGSSTHGAAVSDFEDGVITHETFFDDVGALRTGLRVAEAIIGPYEDRYGEFADAWASGDTDRIKALYHRDAVLSQPLGGIEAHGRDEIALLAPDAPVSWTPLALSEVGPEGRGEFALYLGPTTEFARDPQKAVGVYQTELQDGCSIQTAVRWELADGLIVDERRYPEIDSFRRCFPDDLPNGWWTGLDLPGPRDEVVTGTIQTAQQDITVRNGTDRLTGLARWGLDRFEAAGLPEPRIATVTFEPSRSCGDLSGRVVQENGSRHLFLCLHDHELCPVDEACAVPGLNSRLGALHELGHAWLLDQADQATRSSLLEASGLTTWSNLSVPWQERGSEYAAEVLAWGLLDERIPMVRIGNPECSELTEAFEILTGTTPLVTLEECL